MSFFATPYEIHFDDTMAYGSHHFLTGFKFQCAGRESLLYGELIFDKEGVRESLDKIHLFTADAYSRNLRPTFLGDRVVILITLEEWGRVSARFCYRVLGQEGQPICAGFQTMICADAETGNPIPLPQPLKHAFDAIREIEEVDAEALFRDRVLMSVEATEKLFTDEVRELAKDYLSDRYTHPQIIGRQHNSGELGTNSQRVRPGSAPAMTTTSAEETTPSPIPTNEEEVWVFPGQGAFDPALLCERIHCGLAIRPALRAELDECRSVVEEIIGGDTEGLLSGDVARCLKSVQTNAGLSQVAIHMQSVLGAELRMQSRKPALLMGHSFGELAALSAAGCFDLQTGTRAVCERVRVVDQLAPPAGGLLVVASNRRTAAEEIAVLGLSDTVIAGRNHERQTVVSGPIGQLDQLRLQLESQGVNATSIPSPTSFHHPSLRAAAAQWLRRLRALPIVQPGIPVYSPIGRRSITAHDDVPAILVSQFLRPFDLQGAIDDLVAGGFSAFVDCGSSGSLARLLAAAGPDSMTVLSSSESTPQAVSAVDASSSLRTSSTTGISTTMGAVEKKAAPSADELQIDTASVDTKSHPHSQQAAPQATASSRPPIAIVSQGCLLPGRATSPEELHKALLQGRQGIFDRRDRDPNWEQDFYSEELISDRSTSGLSGLVDDRDLIVPEGVDAQTFAGFSRAQKLLCVALAPCAGFLRSADRALCLIGTTADGFEDQDGFAALRYAGIDVRNSQVADRVGSAKSAIQDPYTAIREVVDHVLRPGLELRLVDAACASSLYCMALGMHALENDETDVVLAGGVFCPGPGNNCLFSQFGGLTSTGCRPFDADASGVVFAEGAAVVALRRLQDARRLPDPIAAVVRGAGLSSDGRSPSANVPQTAGQLHALRRCYENYDVAPGSIVAIEGHGTSTPVGDSTEVKTLDEFYSKHTNSDIPVHSLKGLLGHTGWAAGTASVIASCEALRTGVFPAQAFHREPSAALKAARSLRVPTQPEQLPTKQRRIAIDGFGFGGSNAHVVVEAYDPASECDGDFAIVGKHSASESSLDELVMVAWHRVEPNAKDSSNGHATMRFDRDRIELPDGVLVLPDLADDMDVSQSLALAVVGATLEKIDGFDDELRNQTGIVLALEGKTERAVEATTRILSERISRDLTGLSEVDSLREAAQRARASGAYTLQCMMPNVAAGRAALVYDLNGPNFVVDSGVRSLESAFASAQQLLSGGEACGSKLIIVAAIDANRWRVTLDDEIANRNEYAVAFALTTRRLAMARGLQPICPMNYLTGDLTLNSQDSKWHALRTTEQKLNACIQSLSEFQQEADWAVNSHAKNGREANGHAANGHAANGLAANGHAGNGHAGNGHAGNGHAANGHSTKGNVPQGQTGSTDLPSSSHQDVEPSEFPIHRPVWVESSLSDSPSHVMPRMIQRCLVLTSVEGQRFDELHSALQHQSEELLVIRIGQASAATDRNVIVAHPDHEQQFQSALELGKSFEPTAIVVIDECKNWNFHQVIDDVASNALCEATFLAMRSLAARIRTGATEVWGIYPGGWQNVIHPKTGALSGLVKSTKREMPESRMAVIALRGDSFEAAFSHLQQERQSPTNEDQDIVIDDRKRLVRRLRQISATKLEAAADSKPALDEHSVVVATGGARGVTAIMVDALLRDHGCTVIALGRSPLEEGPEEFDSPEVEQAYYARFLAEQPQSSPVQMRKSFESARARWEAHKTIQNLGKSGGRIQYAALDVTDENAVRNFIGEVVNQYGRIDLIIHGAGVQWSKKIEDRSLAEFRKTFGVKVKALHQLITNCEERLGRIVPTHVLTSAYSIFGNDGQHDYGAANESMDRLCGLTAKDHSAQWTSIAWSAWNGIGMTRGSEYRALAEKRNLALLTPEVGQSVFRAVMEGRTGAEINVPLSDSERSRYRVKTIPAGADCDGTRTVELTPRIADIECLSYHKARGTSTLPGAWIVDLMVQAAATLDSSHATHFAIEGMRFQRFLRIANQHDPNIRVIVDGTPEGYQAWMIGNVLNPDGITLLSDVVFARAKLTALEGDSLSSPQLNGIRNGHGDIRTVTDPYCAGQQSVDLSGPFDCLNKIEIGPLGRRAKFVPETDRKWGGEVPSLLLDASLRVAGMHTVPNALHVPTKIDRVVVPVGISTDSVAASGWKIRTSAPNVHGDDILCDRVEVTDDQGNLRLYVEGALVTRLR